MHQNVPQTQQKSGASALGKVSGRSSTLPPSELPPNPRSDGCIYLSASTPSPGERPAEMPWAGPREVGHAPLLWPPTRPQPASPAHRSLLTTCSPSLAGVQGQLRATTVQGAPPPKRQRPKRPGPDGGRLGARGKGVTREGGWRRRRPPTLPGTRDQSGKSNISQRIKERKLEI